ncbi:MAG: DMT family transporter [Pseudomonadota bacterium]
MTSHFLIKLAGLIFVAVSFIVLGDTAGKALTSQGTPPIFVAWTRFAIAALLMLPFSGLTRRELPVFTDWRIIGRAIILAVGVSCILTGLQTEPIANVFGAFFIGPVVSFVLAVLLLGERATFARFWLLLLGFAGVLLVVKPGFGFTPGIGWALLAGICYGVFLVSTRVVAPLYRPRLLLISQLIIAAIVLSPFGIATSWPPLDPVTLALVTASAVGSAIGNYLIVISNRQADASLIAPLIYTQLISATAAGYFAFGDWPDAWVMLGLVVILVSGLGTLWLVRDTK